MLNKIFLVSLSLIWCVSITSTLYKSLFLKDFVAYGISTEETEGGLDINFIYGNNEYQLTKVASDNYNNINYLISKEIGINQSDLSADFIEIVNAEFENI